jgi:predicted CopG family antitoxin
MPREYVTINVDPEFWEFIHSQKRRGQSMQEVIEELIEIADEECEE